MRVVDEAEKRLAALELADAAEVAAQYEIEEQIMASRARAQQEERDLDAAVRLSVQLNEGATPAPSQGPSEPWAVAIDGLNICREKSYRDPEFKYGRYFRNRRKRYGDNYKGNLRPALAKPLLILIRKLQDLGAEPTVFLPAFALDPNNEDCIYGHEALLELLNRTDGPAIAPVGGLRSEDDQVMLAWAIPSNAIIVSNDRFSTEAEQGRVDPTWIDRNVKRVYFVRNQIVFKDPL
tara:strand:+ start:2107 stop:2814 length:708 start_codon:yes stop_codon:yes gene_type:complete